MKYMFDNSFQNNIVDISMYRIDQKFGKFHRLSMDY